MVKTEPETMVSMCHELLEQPDVEAAIRVGDVYALMIEWFYSQRQMEQAHTLVEKMRGRGIILSPYLDAEMVQAIYGAMASDSNDDGTDSSADGDAGLVLDDVRTLIDVTWMTFVGTSTRRSTAPRATSNSTSVAPS